jgi:hypothetical protein
MQYTIMKIKLKKVDFKCNFNFLIIILILFQSCNNNSSEKWKLLTSEVVFHKNFQHLNDPELNMINYFINKGFPDSLKKDMIIELNKDFIKINGLKYNSTIGDSIIYMNKSDMIYSYSYYRKKDTLILNNEMRQGRVIYKFISSQ